MLELEVENVIKVKNTAVSLLFHLNLKELESGPSKCNSVPIEARHLNFCCESLNVRTWS